MKSTEFLKLLKEISIEELVEVKGLGEKLAQNVIEFRDSERYNLLLTHLADLEKQTGGIEVDPVTAIKSTAPQTLAGEIIVITGSFDIPRPQIKAMLEERGGKVTGSITKNTTILVAGEKAGSKLSKAEKFGTRVVNDYNELL